MGGVGSGARSKKPPVDGQEPEIPDWLGSGGSELWLSVVSSLRSAGMLDSALGELIAAYVRAALDVRECERRLAVEGITQEGPDGLLRRHPCATMRDSAVARMSRLANQLGIVNMKYNRVNRRPIDSPTTSNGTDDGDLALKLYERANKRKKASG